MSNNQQYSFGLNTRNISTSNRSAKAVMIGSIKGKGSTSRIYNWCNKYCPADPINCVFNQVTSSTSPVPVPVSKSSWSNINISQLNLGEITGNIGLNGQIILGGANGGQLQFSTNLGNSWAPYSNSPNLPSIQVSIDVIGWSSVVMSDDTKFVIGTPYVPDNASAGDFTAYNGIWYRRDTAGWFLLQSCPLEGSVTDLNFNNTPKGSQLLFIDAGISQDGNFMAAITTPRSGNEELVYLIYSNDFGSPNSWKAIGLDPYTDDFVTTVTSSISICNYVSDYFLITSKLYFNNVQQPGYYENGTCCVSDAGQSFTVPNGVTGNDFIYSSMSDTGQHQVVVTATNPQSGNTSIPSRLYLSSDSGTNFSQIIQLPYTNDNNYLVFGGVSMSSDGTYITASVLDQDGNFQYIYISSDIGVTWTKIYNDNNGSAINVTGQYAGFLNLNFSGQYQMLTGTNKLYINNNYGN
jgi:hypothetical protein